MNNKLVIAAVLCPIGAVLAFGDWPIHMQVFGGILISIAALLAHTSERDA